ncbi:MAG: flippase [Sporolactobacillus sp.]
MSIKKNYMYNLIYQLLIMMLPLITVPYISRVLHPNGVGTYAFTSSIVSYFTIIGMLGIGTYGNKLIAMTRDNKIEMSRNFLSIYLLQVMLTLSMIIFYLLFVCFFIREEKLIAYIQTLTLFGTLTDCSWFFFGIELFKQIVTRNIVIKLSSLLAIFVFVKNPYDLAVYTFIMCLSNLISSLIMWFYLKGRIVLVKPSFHSILKHLRPTIIYFFPQIALQIYFVLNKTMIGVVSTNTEVGIFDYADKIKSIGLSGVASLGTVMLPRMAHTFATGQIDKAKAYLSKSLDFSTLLAVPIMFGLAGISKWFIPWYMGIDFEKCSIVLPILAATIFFMAWSGVFGNQYLVPLGRMRAYTFSLYVGAVVNFGVNILLIKPYGSIGASIGTLLAESAVTVVQLFFVRSIINLRFIMKNTVIYLCNGFIMYLIVCLIGEKMGVGILTTIIQIIGGFLSYSILSIIFGLIKRDSTIYEGIRQLRGTLKI